MSDIRLDLDPTSPSFGDILLQGGDVVMVDGKDAILQHILQRLKTFQEEWFLDITAGVPYLQQILVKNPDLNKVDALLVDEITGTPGVEDLLEFSSDVNGSLRQLTVSFKAKTTDGIVDYSGLVK